MPQLRPVHAVAAVGDAQRHPVALGHCLDLHLTARAVVFDGVGQQVQQHLAQAGRVGHHLDIEGTRGHDDVVCADVQAEHGGAGCRPQQRQRLCYQRRQRHRPAGDAQLTALQAGQVEHVVDQRQQMPPGGVDVVQPPPARTGRRFVGQQQLGEA